MPKHVVAPYRTTTHLPWDTAMELVENLYRDGKPNDALMCAAGFYFGLRISDTLNLKWKDLLSDQFMINENKTGKRRIITVNSAMRELSEKIFPTTGQTLEDFVFVSQERGRGKGREGLPISSQAAILRFRKALQRYNIKTGNASTHTMRKTFGRRIWDQHDQSEASLVLLSHIFNHSTIAITRRYLGITQEEISKIYKNL